MSTPQKELLAKWLPLIVALVGNMVVVAYGYGKLEQRMAPIESQISMLAHDKLSQQYVTRAEFSARTAQRDREMTTQNEWLVRIEQKLDRLLERQNGGAPQMSDIWGLPTSASGCLSYCGYQYATRQTATLFHG